MPHRWAPSPYQRKERLAAEKQATLTPQPKPPYRIYTLSLTPIRMEDHLHWCYIAFQRPVDVAAEQTRLSRFFPGCKVYSGWLHFKNPNTWLLVDFAQPVRVAELLAAAEHLWGGHPP